MDKSRLSRLCRLLFRQLPLGLSAALLTVGVTINFINAVGRYGFDAAIFWAEEAMVYLAIWPWISSPRHFRSAGSALRMRA